MLSSLADAPAARPIERVLAAFPAAIAGRAADALSVILHGRITEASGTGWSCSRLTGDGYPFELAFTTADDGLRYTAEPTSSSVAPARRLDAAIDLLSALGAVVPAEAVRRLRDVQAHGELAYGAWIGGRHSAASDQYKLYVEVPAGLRAAASVDPLLESPRLADRAVRPRIVGYVPATNTYEVYFQVEALAPYHLYRLLSHCQLEGRAAWLAQYVQDAYAHALRDKLPGSGAGISYASTGQERPHVMTLFLFARAVWGSDARIRRSFVQAAAALGADTERYALLTQSLAERQSAATRHGMVGLTLGPGQAFALSVGLRPESAD